MIELFERDRKAEFMQSSKGNQLKWKKDGIWYKADSMGYEGLAEYVVSHLLTESDLDSEDFILYETEIIQYKKRQMSGCRSLDFLKDGWQLITLERLFQQQYGRSLYMTVFEISDARQRLPYLVDQVEYLTGICDFGIYMNRLMTIDAFFKNEDRHMHNIAVLLDPSGKFHLCPIYDQGASLLSDTLQDYPLAEETSKLMESVEAKTFASDFDLQLDCSEELYGQNLHFTFTIKMVEDLLKSETCYPEKVKARVLEILRLQMRKYQYLF